MPSYTYKCECGETQDIAHSIKEDPEIKCECGKIMSRAVSLGGGAFVKGPTASKYAKEDRLRRKRNAKLEVAQIEKYTGKGKLVPNVEGQEVESWEDAKKLAKDLGSKNTAVIDKYIEEEKHSKNSNRVDERRLAAAREKARQIY